MTSKQRKNKAKNERRAELKQQRAKEAKEAAKKKSNKLMEVGGYEWAGTLLVWWLGRQVSRC